MEWWVGVEEERRRRRKKAGYSAALKVLYTKMVVWDVVCASVVFQCVNLDSEGGFHSFRPLVDLDGMFELR